MNKSREKVLEDIKLKRGFSNASDPRWYWRLRHFSETVTYWMAAFPLPLAVFIGIITQDFWKGLATFTVILFYHLNGNIRGLFIHLEHLIEWVTKTTV